MSNLAQEALKKAQQVTPQHRLSAAFSSAVTGKKHPIVLKSEKATEALEAIRDRPMGSAGYSQRQKTASNFFISKLQFAKNPQSLALQGLGRQISMFGADVRVGTGALGIFDTALKEGLL